MSFEDNRRHTMVKIYSDQFDRLMTSIEEHIETTFTAAEGETTFTAAGAGGGSICATAGAGKKT
jgi:hypothetical protein